MLLVLEAGRSDLRGAQLTKPSRESDIGDDAQCRLDNRFNIGLIQGANRNPVVARVLCTRCMPGLWRSGVLVAAALVKRSPHIYIAT